MLALETHSRTVLSFISVLSFSGTLLAQGGGLAVYEVGTPNVGEAYAGQAAVASDASTAFLNPAGMTRLNGTQFLAGSPLDLLSAHFIAGPTTSSEKERGECGWDVSCAEPLLDPNHQ
jgi:long-subunit fatty acid transport protein